MAVSVGGTLVGVSEGGRGVTGAGAVWVGDTPVGREVGRFWPDEGEQPDNNNPRMIKTGNTIFLIILSS